MHLQAEFDNVAQKMLCIGMFETTLFLTYHSFVQFWPSRLVKATICWPFSFSSLLKSLCVNDSFEGPIIFNVSYKYLGQELSCWDTVRSSQVIWCENTVYFTKLFNLTHLNFSKIRYILFFTGTTTKTHCYSTIKRKKY